MSVHIGQVTSEVTAVGSVPDGPARPTEAESIWEQRRTLAAALARLDRDRHRTATGHGDD